MKALYFEKLWSYNIVISIFFLSEYYSLKNQHILKVNSIFILIRTFYLPKPNSSNEDCFVFE